MSTVIFRGFGKNILWGGKFEIYGTETNDGVENKNRTVIRVTILISFQFIRIIFIVS